MINPSQNRSTYNDETSMGLCALDGTMLALKNLVAKGKLRNQLLELSVEQHYQNSGTANVEAVYTFPLMPDAVLLGLELIIGDRHLFGVSVPVAEARQSYEQALEDGNSAVMLEKATDGLYTVNIGNLLAGESACIRYQYAQPIGTKNGAMRITIPTTVPPRYGNSAAQLQPHQVPESDVIAEYAFSLSVHIEGESNHAVITSPTHETTLSRAEDGLTINFPAAYLDRDAVIMVKSAQQAAVYLAETSAGCIAYAPVAVSLPEDTRPSAARSLRLVIDCSGSMGGASILSARRGAMRAIETLTEADEFSITRFGSRFEHYRTRLLQASFGTRAMALRYLHSTDANLGGTEMQSALMAASQLVGESSRSDVLLVTDGEIWDIDPLIRFALDSGMRYFVVGVGFSPSHENLARLAESTGGAYLAVTPGEDIEQAILDVMTRIQQPSVRNAHLSWSADCLWQTRMPDTLFSQESIAVFAGLAANPGADAVLGLAYSIVAREEKGNRNVTSALSVKPWSGDPEVLLRVASAVRIRDLEAGFESTPRLAVEEATQLAVSLNLLSRTTNYLVVLERAEAEKAIALPSVVTVKQMALPMLSQCAKELPAFFSKIELAVDTQKFLRCESNNAVHETFAAALNRRMNERGTGLPPSRVAVLVSLGLEDKIAKVLGELIQKGNVEADVVCALLIVMLQSGRLDGLSASNSQTILALEERLPAERLNALRPQLISAVGTHH